MCAPRTRTHAEPYGSVRSAACHSPASYRCFVRSSRFRSARAPATSGSNSPAATPTSMPPLRQRVVTDRLQGDFGRGTGPPRSKGMPPKPICTARSILVSRTSCRFCMRRCVAKCARGRTRKTADVIARMLAVRPDARPADIAAEAGMSERHVRRLLTSTSSGPSAAGSVRVGRVDGQPSNRKVHWSRLLT